MRTLRLDAFLPDGAVYRAARVTVAPRHRMHLHTHDFAEVFWIEQGSGVHIVNGTRRQLVPGDVVLMRPDDEHTFRTQDREGLTQINVAFDHSVLDDLQKRYFDGGTWPWSGADLPAAWSLGESEVARLAALGGLLFAGPATRLVLDHALLSLLHRLTAPALRPGLPLWLGQALRDLEENPTALADGVTALAAHAGRSREHVNRVARRTTGRTATELVQELRLERAALDLRLTDAPITRIAFDCGFGNLSHFYRLFGRRFGTTPRRYRLRHQELVRGEPLAAGRGR